MYVRTVVGRRRLCWRRNTGKNPISLERVFNGRVIVLSVRVGTSHKGADRVSSVLNGFNVPVPNLSTCFAPKNVVSFSLPRPHLS